jgi:hypothetical protein
LVFTVSVDGVLLELVASVVRQSPLRTELVVAIIVVCAEPRMVSPPVAQRTILQAQGCLILAVVENRRRWIHRARAGTDKCKELHH